MHTRTQTHARTHASTHTHTHAHTNKQAHVHAPTHAFKFTIETFSHRRVGGKWIFRVVRKVSMMELVTLMLTGQGIP